MIHLTEHATPDADVGVQVGARERSHGMDEARATPADRRPAVLMLAYAFPPASPIGTLRTLRLLKRFDVEGWSATVVTVTPRTYPSGMPMDQDLHLRVPPGVRVVRAPVLRPLERMATLAGRRTRRVQDAAPVERTPVGRPPHRSLAMRMYASLDSLTSIPDREVGWILPALVTGAACARHDRVDVLYSSAPPWSGQVAALGVARATGLPWVAYFRDPWARAPWREALPDRARRVAAALERRVVARADAILFATTANRDEYAAFYGPALADKFHVVVNGSDPEEFCQLPAAPPRDRFVVLHAGSLYGARSPMPLFRAVASAIRKGVISSSRIHMRFIGASGTAGAFEAAAATLGLENVVEFLPRMPRKEIVAEMASASCLLVLQPGTTVSIPGKLYEYFAVGRPILALCEEGETADLVTESRIGIAVRPHDEVAIEEALRRLMAGELRCGTAPPHLYDGNVSAARAVAIVEATWRARRRAVASA